MPAKAVGSESVMGVRQKCKNIPHNARRMRSPPDGVLPRRNKRESVPGGSKMPDNPSRFKVLRRTESRSGGGQHAGEESAGQSWPPSRIILPEIAHG